MPTHDDVFAFAFAASKDKDAGKRIHEAVALHLTASSLSDVFDNVVGKWLAFKLADGSVKDSSAIYDSKDDAIRAMEPYEKDYCYLKITPDGITLEDAFRFLRINRHPMIDTTAPEHKMNPVLMPHMSNLSRAERRRIANQAGTRNN